MWSLRRHFSAKPEGEQPRERVTKYSSADEGALASNSDGDGLSRTLVGSAQEGQVVVGGALIDYLNSTNISTFPSN